MNPTDSFSALFFDLLCLPCCLWAFSTCGDCGVQSGVVCGLLIAVPSLVAEHRLWAVGASVVAAWGL